MPAIIGSAKALSWVLGVSFMGRAASVLGKGRAAMLSADGDDCTIKLLAQEEKSMQLQTELTRYTEASDGKGLGCDPSVQDRVKELEAELKSTQEDNEVTVNEMIEEASSTKSGYEKKQRELEATARDLEHQLKLAREQSAQAVHFIASDTSDSGTVAQLNDAMDKLAEKVLSEKKLKKEVDRLNAESGNMLMVAGHQVEEIQGKLDRANKTFVKRYAASEKRVDNLRSEVDTLKEQLQANSGGDCQRVQELETRLAQDAMDHAKLLDAEEKKNIKLRLQVEDLMQKLAALNNDKVVQLNAEAVPAAPAHH